MPGFDFKEEWKAMQMADAKITKALAREIAADVPAFARWDQVRELADLATGDLDCWQLDRLTDWVTAIVDERAREAGYDAGVIQKPSAP